MSNLISKLPEEIQQVALEYQRNETDSQFFSKTADELSYAFSWDRTKEGIYIWKLVFIYNYQPFYDFHKIKQNTMEQLIQNIIEWAKAKGINKKENSLAQMAKVTEEVGELASALIKKNNDKLIDSIGDVIVTIVILAEQNGLNVKDCLEVAYNEIKDRKGKTIDGTFIKE